MRKLNLVYWEDGHRLLGKIMEHPDVWAEGEDLAELEENIKENYLIMVMEDVPYDYKVKEIIV